MKTRRNWFWGLFLLLAGVLVVVGQVSGFANIGFWSILATVALAALFITCLVKLNFPVALVCLALLYIIYMEPLSLIHIQPWLLLLAAVLVGVGLSMLFRRRPRDHWDDGQWQGAQRENGQWVPPAPGEAGSAPDSRVYMEASDDNHPYSKVSFGATSRYLHSTALESGYFKCGFGAIQVYFEQAQLVSGGAEVFFDVSFGGVQLYIPRNWNVEIDVRCTLGGVSNENEGACPDRSLPPLRLRGNVQVGGIEITYV